jgi:hypothetical protein
VQTTGLPPVHVPAWQASVWVQALPSSQLVPFVTGVWTQPVSGLQLSAVHGLLSSHEMAALEHEPPAQTPEATWHLSVVVQAIPLLSWQLPVALQAWHWPQALLVQQKPSVQLLPVLHWLVVVQTAPRSSLNLQVPIGRSSQ